MFWLNPIAFKRKPSSQALFSEFEFEHHTSNGLSVGYFFQENTYGIKRKYKGTY